MSFLKKLGEVIAKGVNLAKGALPVVGKVTEAVSPYLPALGGAFQSDLKKIAEVIAEVEVFGQVLGHPGPDKLKAVTPVVAQIILQSSLLAGHQVEKPELFTKGAEQIAAGMADVLNSLQADAVKTS